MNPPPQLRRHGGGGSRKEEEKVVIGVGNVVFRLSGLVLERERE